MKRNLLFVVLSMLCLVLTISAQNVFDPNNALLSPNWHNSTDNPGVAGDDVFVNGSKKYSTTSPDLNVTTLNPTTPHTIAVRDHDLADNFSGFSNTIKGTIAMEDVTPPSVPTNLHVAIVNDITITLGWNKSTDDVGVTGYDIFVNGTKQYSSTTTDVVVINLQPSTRYSFTVQAHDQANNFSGFTNTVIGTTSPAPNAVQPTTPTNLHVVSVGLTSVTLDWDNSLDDVAVVGYRVFVGGSNLYSTTTSDFVVNLLDPGTAYTFVVQAYDGGNNSSLYSNAAYGTTSNVMSDDKVPPSTPTNLHAVLNTTRAITLDWDNSTDNVGVAGYDVYVGIDKKFTTVNSEIVIENLFPGTEYTFRVKAHDEAYNLSAFSSIYTAATPFIDKPSNLHVITVTDISVALDWDDVADVTTNGYDIFVNGAKRFSSGKSDFVAGSLIPNTTYTFMIQAHNAIPNYSAFSNVVTATTTGVTPPPDTIPPGAPANLHLVSATGGSITLDWDNSIDNVGVAGYDVFINGAKTFPTTNSDYVVNNLKPNTTYTFMIQAHDVANNYSEFSNLVSGTTSGSNASGALNYKFYQGSFLALPHFNVLTPVQTGNSDNIDISVRPGVNDNFAFVWEGNITITTPGTYTFETVSDDGSKLYFNSLYSDGATALVNNDGRHPVTSATGTVNIPDAGTYPIAVTFFELDGGETMEVYWSGPGIPRQRIPNSAFVANGNPPPVFSGLNYKYYEGSWSALPNFNALTPVKTGTSSNADISVRTPGVNDNFGFLWEGYINITTPGIYTFETVSDDGSKLYFNSLYSNGASALVNNDGIHAGTSATGTVNIPAAGTYPISVTFFERDGGETMEIYWSGPGIPRQRIPNSAFMSNGNPPPGVNGLNYKYYEGSWTALPNFNSLTPVKTGTSSTADITVRTPGVNDNFGFLWEGYINIATPGVYTFETVSDDGSKVYFNSTYSFDGAEVVNNDGLHPALPVNGTVDIPVAGIYPIAITFFELSGDETMEVYWTGPGIERQLIPNSAFRLNNTAIAGIVNAQRKNGTAPYADRLNAEMGNMEMNSVYPNPFTNSFTIYFNNATAANNISVDLVDVSGRLLLKQNFGNMAPGATTLKMNVGNKVLLPGVYFARLNINGKPMKLMKLVRK